MLQAIHQRKSKIYRRYLGERDGTEAKVAEEDELTALLLGPLQFMPERNAALFWHQLLLEFEAPNYCPDTSPEGLCMKFWPSFPAGSRQRVEPDLLVELTWPDGKTLKLIVELKWRAPLSGDHQLHRQWQHCLTSQEQATAYHLFIAPETSEAQAALGSDTGDIWKGRLLSISWYELMGLFDQSYLDLGVWPEMMTHTLDCLGIHRFKGFKSLHSAPEVVFSAQRPVFWNSPIHSLET